MEERQPKAADGEFLLEVTRIKLFQGREAGLTYLVENKIHTSSNPQLQSVCSWTASNLDPHLPEDKRNPGLSKVKSFIAALAGVDARDPNIQDKLLEYAIASASSETAGEFVGRQYRLLAQGATSNAGHSYQRLLFAPAGA